MGLNMHNLLTKVWINATEVEDYDLAQEHGLSIVTVSFKDCFTFFFFSLTWLEALN
jgi:hypothetical protein